MSKLNIKRESCKACYYCIAACPKEALKVSDYTNKKGHRPPDVDLEKCVACGTCFIVCPDYVFEINGDQAIQSGLGRDAGTSQPQARSEAPMGHGGEA